MTAKTILAMAQTHRKEPSRANYDALASAVRELLAERDELLAALQKALEALKKTYSMSMYASASDLPREKNAIEAAAIAAAEGALK